MIEINKRFTEVMEVLNHLDPNYYNMIPSDVISLIENNKTFLTLDFSNYQNYIWKYDETKDLINQNLPRDTIVILSMINTNYLLNPDQQEYFIKLHKYNQTKVEEEKLNKHDPTKLFEDNLSHMSNNEEITEDNKDKQMIVVKKSFINTIINKLKSLLFKK